MISRFSVFGLGKLGASMAAAIGSRGLDVIGVDINQKAVDLVNEGHAPVQETDLEKYISTYSDRIKATMSHEEAVLKTDLSFVIVPTPSDERGAFSLQYAAWAFKAIGKALAKKDTYHNVVLTSTVLPGATRQALIPILEKESGKTAGKDFGVCYSPEFIALGSVIRDFLNPDFTLVGEIDDRAGSQLAECYSRIMPNQPPCQRMSLENAELTKIAVNTYVTTKITFANMLADLCERIPGGDVDVVSNALGMDARIGRKYLTGAIGYGGPCFPRDNVALSFIARAMGTKADLAETTDHANRTLAEKITNRLRHLISDGTTVAVLGLSYKPFAHIVEESQGVALAKALSRAGARVVGYDPLANEMARNELHDQALVLDSLEECLAQATVVVVTTPDPAFKDLTAKDFGADDREVTVIDFWRILRDALSGQKNVRYIPIGQSVDDEANTERLRELWGSPLD
jgi:UDPglucose 6-dehydrogenase